MRVHGYEFRDGIGDIELMHCTVRADREVPGTGADFAFFNGLPTAEMTAPTYRGIGVGLYSSAVFAFAQEIAPAFHPSLQEGDETAVQTLFDPTREQVARLAKLIAHGPGGRRSASAANRLFLPCSAGASLPPRPEGRGIHEGETR